MQAHELFDGIFKEVTLRANRANLFALSRIDPPSNLVEGLLSNLARLGKPQYGIPVERETARLTAKRYRSTNDFVPDGATRDAEAGESMRSSPPLSLRRRRSVRGCLSSAWFTNSRS